MNKTGVSASKKPSLVFSVKKLLIASAFLVFLAASVSAAPAITLTPSTGNVGDTVRINATGWSANGAYIFVTFGGTTVSLTADTQNGTKQNANNTVNATAGGAWNATFTVPTKAGGPQTVNATNNSAGDSAVATFIVTEKITLNLTSGIVGDVLLVSGTGFNTSATVAYLKFAGSTVNSSSTTINSDGTFVTNFTFLVPNATKGSKTVQVTTDSNATGGGLLNVQTTFTVNPKVTSVSPSVGTVGSSVAVAGTGFTAEALQIYVNTTQATISSGNSSVNADGTFSSTITVPTLVKGIHVLRVNTTTDATGNTSTFTVSPQITAVGPGVATVGSTININGTGFTAEALNVSFNGTMAVIASGNLTVNANGTFSTSVIVPNVTGGVKVLRVNTTTDATGNTTT
jgi:hypothetical protein